MIINQNNLQFDAYDDVLIKWKSDNQEYYLNPFEGCFYDKNNDYLKINKREIVEVNELNKIYTKNAISFKYDKKLEMLAIFTLEIKYYRPENNSPYKIKWEEIDRVYVDFDKNWWIAINKEENREYKNIGFCKKNKLPFNYELLNVGDWLIEIYNCFGSVVCIKDNFFYDIENIDDFIYFITKKEPTKSKSKKQKELDLLVQKDNKKINFEEYYFQFGDIVSIAYKVEEDISCIRCFCADYNYQKIVEGCRIYITKDNFYVGYKKTNGDIVYLSKDLTCENLALPLILLDYDFCENTLLKYNFENIILTDPTKRLNAIMAFLKWDIFEKLYKAGYINICKYCFDLEGETALSSLEMVFRRYGKKYEKGISIKEFTGLNTYQLKELNILFKKYLKTKKVINPIKYLQSWFGANLFSVDNTTFKRSLNCIEFALEAEIEEMFCSLISYIIDLKSFKYVCKHFDEICNIVENNKDSCSKIWWRKYRDYVRAISHPKMREYNCPLLFKNKEELQKEHEKISKTYCMIISKNNDEIFIEKEKIWEDKFYYKNEKFSIIGPKCILDIVTEGNKLKHCVKDYIEDIILGRKIILFLRKNNDLKTPYFTIEITKNIVTQIHGFKNCNLPINSEEIQFIEKWMEFKEIQKGDYNLLR